MGERRVPFWRRQQLRRGRGEIGRQEVNRDPENGRDNSASAEKQHETQKAKTNKAKRKHGTTAEIIVACFTGLLLWVAWRQNGIQDRQANISESQLALSQYQASSSDAAQAASLNVSEIAARATQAQAEAMKKMADAADKQAAAAQTQTKIFDESLRLSRTAQLALEITPMRDLEAGKRPSVTIRLTNTGGFAVDDVEIASATYFVLPGESFETSTAQPSFQRDNVTKTRSLFSRGYQDRVATIGRFPLDAAQVQHVRTGIVKLYVIALARYRDANGMHTMRECAGYWGDFLPEGRACQ